ncbi:MAG: hypothetical protein JXA18_09755 [Chitinispirillaceae bacterium]|nr:hypothetical protein [Chitinispirillaceae bacterium]
MGRSEDAQYFFTKEKPRRAVTCNPFHDSITLTGIDTATGISAPMGRTTVRPS